MVSRCFCGPTLMNVCQTQPIDSAGRPVVERVVHKVARCLSKSCYFHFYRHLLEFAVFWSYTSDVIYWAESDAGASKNYAESLAPQKEWNLLARQI